MNKNDLINELAVKLNITRTASKQYLEAFEETLGDALEEGEPVVLQGFGTFSRWQQAGRPGRNPKTGAPV
ncbi:MAG: HU family DNA-binding protein [Parabacteroides sp.]|nr:HU family DNA-binding protein [Parabacteroides sp.]